MAEKISIKEFLNSNQPNQQRTEEIRVKEKDRFFQIDRKIKVHLQLQKLDQGEILIDFSLPIKIKLFCSRCLKPFSYSQKLKFKRIFRLKPDQAEIKIAEPIKEELLIHLPIKPLCHEDCQGICPQCGQDLNREECQCRPEPTGHPAFKELKKLKNSLDG